MNKRYVSRTALRVRLWAAMAVNPAAVLLLCASASAQDTPQAHMMPERTRAEAKQPSAAGDVRTQIAPAPSHRPGGFTVAAFTGGAHTLDSPLTISQPALNTRLTFRGVRFDGRSLEPPLYYGFRGGYFFRRKPSLGVEAEFIHLKVYSDPARRVRATGTRRGASLDRELPLGEIVERYSISHGVNLLLFNLAARRTFGAEGGAGRPRFIITGRAGAGPTIPHTESTIEGTAREQYEFGRLAVQAAGGAEVRIAGGLYALGEYKFTRTRQRGRVAGGEAESLLRTHHGVFGLSYHF